MRWRLMGWSTFVAFMSALNYAAQLSSGTAGEGLAYKWSSSILGAAQYAVMFGMIMLLRARPRATAKLPRAASAAHDMVASRRHRRSRILAAVFVVSAIVAQFATSNGSRA